MGFITLEDIQGNIELVLFPRTWAQFQPVLEIGKIVLVNGKVDTQSNPPKVLVDKIQTEIKMIVPADESQANVEAERDNHKSEPGASARAIRADSIRQPVESKSKIEVNRPTQMQKTTTIKVGEQHPSTTNSAGIHSNSEKPDGDSPPPPDNFPTGWDLEWQPSFENAEIAARPEVRVLEEHQHARKNEKDHVIQSEKPIPDPQEDAQPAVSGEVPSVPNQLDGMRLPSLYAPIAQSEADGENTPKQITVLLRSTGDKERDKRRIKTLYGTLISYHGRDRFTFHIYEGGKGHMIDFPGDTTRICAEMLERLKRLIGDETWRVEQITYQ
jgi:DNA polymerase-3 subunit alpha